MYPANRVQRRIFDPPILLFSDRGGSVGVLASENDGGGKVCWGSVTHSPSDGFSLGFDSACALSPGEGIGDAVLGANGNLIVTTTVALTQGWEAFLNVLPRNAETFASRTRFDEGYPIASTVRLTIDPKLEAFKFATNLSQLLNTGDRIGVVWIAREKSGAHMVCLRMLDKQEQGLGDTIVVHRNPEGIACLSSCVIDADRVFLAWMDRQKSLWKLHVAVLDLRADPDSVSEAQFDPTITMPFWPGDHFGCTISEDAVLLPFVGEMNHQSGIWLLRVEIGH